MNIYFSCSITGGRQDQQVYATIVDFLLKSGHGVPTAHLSQPDIMDLEQVVTPLDIYQRDVAWVTGCDALIAEVSTPSHGVGYEIALANFLQKPVLCCYRSGKKVSKMITGNPSLQQQLCSYQTAIDLLAQIEDFLIALPKGN
jgi:nucleoside 2-deoxyribosyltransferase